MATELTKEDFIEILLDNELTRLNDLAVFQTIYSFEGHKTYASQVGRIMGSKAKNPAGPINLQIGRLAKRIAKKFDINFSVRQNLEFKYWDLFFNGWSEGKYWVWELKNTLRLALEETGRTGYQLLADEIGNEEDVVQLYEGAKRTIVVNAYERNTVARQRCIDHYGAFCQVCSFDFGKAYGPIGEGFIHVHHLYQISLIGKRYEVDPVKDLRPVCPNCHAMLHANGQLLTIEELKDLIANKSTH